MNAADDPEPDDADADADAEVEPPADPHGHVPVLIDPVLEHLAPSPGQAFLDVTLGRGGHAAAILPRLAPGGVYVGLDTDADNAAYAEDRLRPIAAEADVTLHVIHADFRALANPAAVLPDGVGAFDRILADLGFASNQVDDPMRGLSFKSEGPLDMRLDAAESSGRPTAADLVNGLPQDELADVIYRFGEERLSRRIARKIVARRESGPIQTTGELARTVRAAYPPPGGGRGGRDKKQRNRQAARQRHRHRIDPATRTFQALRIAVNGELEALDVLLAAAPNLLREAGRLGVISFHSLEDRPVKRAFQALEQAGHGRRVNRKPFIAGGPEQAANPRSRSAKLRVLERDTQPDAGPMPTPPRPPSQP